MPELNVSVPHWQCYVRKEYLLQRDPTPNEGLWEPALVIGISSIPGRALGFHCLTEHGGLFWRLPIHALAAFPGCKERPLSDLQVWDCFSSHFSLHVFDRIDRCPVKAKIGSELVNGIYLMTVDWYGLGTGAEGVGDDGHKCAHIIELEDGNYAALPNNYVRWLDKAFVLSPLDLTEPLGYRTSNSIWKCENQPEAAPITK